MQDRWRAVQRTYLVLLLLHTLAASLIGSTGGAAVQPLLGRAADVWGYPASYACSAAAQACAIPLLWIAHRVAPHRDDAS